MKTHVGHKLPVAKDGFRPGKLAVMSSESLPPIPRHYTRTVAERSFTGRDSSEEYGVRVEFGEPVQDVAVANGMDWRCPMRLTVGSQVTVRSIIGIDSLQALQLAINLARVELEILATCPGTVLLYLDEPFDTTRPDWQRSLV